MQEKSTFRPILSTNGILSIRAEGEDAITQEDPPRGRAKRETGSAPAERKSGGASRKKGRRPHHKHQKKSDPAASLRRDPPKRIKPARLITYD